MSLNLGVLSASVTLQNKDYLNRLKELENKSDSTFKKIAQYAAAYLSFRAVNIENEIQNRLPLLCATGIVDKNTGNVNLDKLEDAGLKAFDKVQYSSPVTRMDVYKKYLQWCENTKSVPMSSRWFWPRMRQSLFRMFAVHKDGTLFLI